MKIKICGVRRDEDASVMNECRPDFIGFVLTPSKRRVSVEEASRISRLLLPEIQRVGVFAQESPEEIADAVRCVPLHGIQLHMDVDDAFLDRLDELLEGYAPKNRPFIWLRISVPSEAKTSDEIRDARKGTANLFRGDAILFDTRAGSRDGGTGVRFPVAPARDFLREEGLSGRPIVLAGGLDADNVEEAIRCFRPAIVDVSGGVEVNGFKDRDRVLRFVETVRKVGAP